MSEGFSQLGQLFWMRLRTLLRDPSVLVWAFAVPLLTSLALGLAFKNRALSRLDIAVADGPDAAALAVQLDAVPGLSARRLSIAEARDELRRGRVALVLVPGPEPELLVDPAQEEGRTAKVLTLDALERLHGRVDSLRVRETPSTLPGSRYIDFLIPGLLGYGLMASSLSALGWGLVQMRAARLLKRLAATPMSRTDLLLSFALSRAVFAVLEIAVFIAFSYVVFGVRVFGGLLSLGMFAMFGVFSFAAMGLALGCRSRSSEAVAGLLNVVAMPMIVLSGVFFSASHFPAWSQPAIKLLPLTALNDGLRAIMIDGAPLMALWSQGLVLAVWGLFSFVFALRFFRWT